MYLNDLATEIKLLNAGVELDDCTISLLLYADDIVLIAPDEVSLQMQLNVVYQWCRRWRMFVNEDATQIVHFRPAGSAVTDFRFIYGSHKLEIVNKYKYLGVFFDEHLSFSSNADALAASAGRALGLLRYKLKFLKECGFQHTRSYFRHIYVPYLITVLGSVEWNTTIHWHAYNWTRYVISWEFINTLSMNWLVKLVGLVAMLATSWQHYVSGID